MKLTKDATKRHDEAVERLEQNVLGDDDRDFVLEYYHPGATNNIGKAGVFFTPPDLAYELALYAPSPSKTKTTIVDVCAGIGMLTHAVKTFQQYKVDQANARFVCLEWNPEFVEVGKKIAPYAEWFCADVFDEAVWEHLGPITWMMSNPPFGNIKTRADTSWLRYKGVKDLMVVELITRFARRGGTVILPQTSVPFRYSGHHYYEQLPETQYPMQLQRFLKVNTVEFNCCSSDISVYKDQWKGAAPTVEMAQVGTTDDSEELAGDADVTLIALVKDCVLDTPSIYPPPLAEHLKQSPLVQASLFREDA
jgi:predicted RNA methylase